VTGKRPSGVRRRAQTPKAAKHAGITRPAEVRPGEAGGFVVTLPLRLVSQLNAREHWAKRHKRETEHRKLAMMLVAMAMKAYRPAGPWRVVITRIAPRPFDGDNMQGAAKGVRDGVADAFGIDDKDGGQVWWGYDQRRGKPREYAVTITVLPAFTQEHPIANGATR
jgi:hypothetical protein